ncbi:PCI domain-containing 2 [Micractinium conductrix]|uniref:PCI domain-containing 2 n=1 Tax=Micractinium conductrix TaxID=554055 RepID=A0A2P6VK90_9CHLO|nr:PCI domain-containing 2 [Micractinium conductrix]|eukprot:PSC74505.1 PCI domain-containing 2 [Micractinium conductrix]
MAAFAAYVQTVGACIARQDGAQLRELVAVGSVTAQQAVLQARQSSARWHPAHATTRLPDGWADFLAFHCACLAALQEGNRVEAYEKAVAALQPFLKVFREDMGAWVVEPMHSVVHNLCSAAQAADLELRQAGQRPDKLGDCGDQLRKCFSVSLQAPGNKEKKLAALDIVNVSIKIYFRLNTLRLCKNLMRTVDSRQFAPFDAFPAAQRITYKFYVGRLAVFDENYHEAQASLNYALQHCHRAAQRNKALILKYLVPVQLLLGRLPMPALIAAHRLHQYEPIIAAMHAGDIKLFSDTMDTQQFRFIQEGTYLLLEKLRYAVYRRLLRKVHAVHAQLEPEKRTQIPLLQFQMALAMQGVELDIDEVECVAANLIFRKYVKGYISHKNKVMVVAKADPFPPLGSVALSD